MTTESRYRNQDLWIPANFHKEYIESERLVDRGGSADVPFARQIDLWWYAFGVGASKGTKTPLPSRDRLVRFNDGGILESDPWRITQLELVVLAEQGEEAASNPSTVVQSANEYANTGFNVLGTELRGVVDLQIHLMAKIGSADVE